MTPQAESALAVILRDMIMERQRLLIREANYLRGLLGLPPVRAEERKGEAKERRGSKSRAGGDAP